MTSADIDWGNEEIVDNGLVGNYLVEPEEVNSDDDKITFTATISTAGYWYGVCIDSCDEEVPLSWQVVFGLTAGSE